MSRTKLARNKETGRLGLRTSEAKRELENEENQSTIKTVIKLKVLKPF